MQKYMEEKFSDSNGRRLFEDFERKYDSKILQKIGKFTAENLESNDMFNVLFKNLSEKAKENSKIFSKLKHEYI